MESNLPTDLVIRAAGNVICLPFEFVSMSCSLGALGCSVVTLLYTSSMRLNYQLAVLVVISLVSFHSHSYDLVD